MNAIPISQAQASSLVGQNCDPVSKFNPFQDALGNWQVSLEEQAGSLAPAWLKAINPTELVQWQLHVILASALIQQAFAVLDQVIPLESGARNPATPTAYSTALSASGSNPPTHYGTTLDLTDSDRLDLLGTGIASVEGVSYWRTNLGQSLEATNSQTAHSMPGDLWLWDDCLTDASLDIIN